MKLWQKIVLGVIAVLILSYAFGINVEYYFTAARSMVIDKVVEDVHGGAPAGTYPVLLLHGFNPTYSGRVSEALLRPLQKSLVGLNYTDKHIYTSKMTCAELRYEEQPFVIRMTYLEQYDLVGIDDYSKYVGRVIAHILECTGAEKVDIVAHSMGGLVARTLIKDVMDEGNDPHVHKLIMLGTPNHGGLYNIGDLTGLLIEDGEAKVDLDFVRLSEDHNFVGRLNEGDETPGDIQYYTIAGDIDGRGDGLVLKESVPLDGAINKTVECEHNSLKFPIVCPEAFSFLTEMIKV
ncbi:alpha/beta hydrolase [Candidatus Woesearchaeota archaeon]|nr:alpha/beta hydrolase [Candidatus Woesearchaeota archaeon]